VLASGIFIARPAVEAGTMLMNPEDLEAVADYRLRTVDSLALAKAIEGALAGCDAELAASLIAVADDAELKVSDEIRQRVTDAQAFDLGCIGRDAWGGLNGDTSSEAGFAAALAGDLTGIGDIVDLGREGGAFVMQKPYDPVVLTLAATGLVVTAATLGTAGAAAPARIGMTVLKAGKKAGSLPAPLVADLVALSRNAIDPAILDETLDAARRVDIPAAGSAASRLLRPKVQETVTRTADDVAAVFTTSGYRALNQSLKVAESTADISELRKLSDSMGSRFRGTLALLGRAVLSIADLLVTLIGWVLAGVVWLIGAGLAVLWFLRAAFSLVSRMWYNRSRATGRT
jgi:hypothetical protein